jgi:hypothetical protein
LDPQELRIQVLQAIREALQKIPLGYVSTSEVTTRVKAPEPEIEGAVKYLEQKGFLDVQWTSAGFIAKITSYGIDELEGRGAFDEHFISGEREVRQKILKALYQAYSNDPQQYATKEQIATETGIEETDVVRAVKYLDEKGLIEAEWFLGGGFIARITALGIDAVEPKEELAFDVTTLATPKTTPMQRPSLTVYPLFPVNAVVENSKLAFVLMPFDKEFNPTYQTIKVIVEGVGLKCVRADEIYGNAPVMEDIWEHIRKARIIIADLTGRNPNVTYEMGICHTLGKEVIPMSQSTRDIPFDVQHIRAVIYENSETGFQVLKKRLAATIESVLGNRIDSLTVV